MKPIERSCFTKTLFLVFMALGLCLSCGHNSSKDLDKNGVPKVLKLGQSTGEEDPSGVLRKLEPIRLYFEEKTGVPVEFFKTTGYAPAIEAMKAKKLHVAGLSPFAYILAKEKAEIDVFVSIGTESGGSRAYHSIIVTKKGSGLKTLADIKSKSKDLTLGFSDPASTSGHFLPRTKLNSFDIDPEKDFKDVVFTTSQIATILSVMSDKTDVVCGSFGALYYVMNKHGYTFDEDINLVWKSPPIISQAKCIRTDINPEFRKKLTDAYVNMKRDCKECWEAIYQTYQKYFPENIDDITYVATSDSMYDGLREMAKETDFTNFMDK